MSFELYLKSYKLLGDSGNGMPGKEDPYYNITIYAPTIWYYKGNDPFEGPITDFRAQATSGFVFKKSDISFYASAALFGFGISFFKQWGF